MKFKFKIQQYQTDAVEQTVNVFAGQQPMHSTVVTLANVRDKLPLRKSMWAGATAM